MEKPKNILVCVTQQKTCERLIRKAAVSRDDSRDRLFVLHVAGSNWNFLNNRNEGEALEYLFNISKSVNAELSVLKSDDIVKAITDFVAGNNITHIILGQSDGSYKENNISKELSHLLQKVEIDILPPEYPDN